MKNQYFILYLIILFFIILFLNFILYNKEGFSNKKNKGILTRFKNFYKKYYYSIFNKKTSYFRIYLSKLKKILI